jgi:hypothetical protein
MTILRPAITLDADEFLSAQGGALRLAGTRDVARRQLRTAAGLIVPAVVYDWVPVVRRGRTAVAGDVVFHLGGHAGLVACAQEVLLAVATIGPALEEQCRALQNAGEPLELFLLHEAGTFAVAKVVQAVHALAEAGAAARSWGVGAELAPGQLAGWPASEQVLFGRLLDLGSIDVGVTDAGLLVPQKSVSLMIGAGPEYPSAEVNSPCTYCDMGDTCSHRH